MGCSESKETPVERRTSYHKRRMRAVERSRRRMSNFSTPDQTGLKTSQQPQQEVMPWETLPGQDDDDEEEGEILEGYAEVDSLGGSGDSEGPAELLQSAPLASLNLETYPKSVSPCVSALPSPQGSKASSSNPSTVAAPASMQAMTGDMVPAVTPAGWARMIVLQAEGDTHVVQEFYAQREQLAQLQFLQPIGVSSPTGNVPTGFPSFPSIPGAIAPVGGRCSPPPPTGRPAPTYVIYQPESPPQPRRSLVPSGESESDSAGASSRSSLRAEMDGGITNGPNYETASAAQSLFSHGSSTANSEHLVRRAQRIEQSLERRHSEGKLAVEPRMLTEQLKTKAMVAKARLVHNITSDPLQFQKSIDVENKKSCKISSAMRLRVCEWMDLVIEDLLEVVQNDDLSDSGTLSNTLGRVPDKSPPLRLNGGGRSCS